MTPHCPTCGATFRGGERCGRCGTELRRLTAVMLAARALREEARRALLAQDAETALERAVRSRRLHDVDAGRHLHALALVMVDRPLEGIRLAATVLDV